MPLPPGRNHSHSRAFAGILFCLALPLLALAQQPKIYQNEKYGYRVAYPDDWFPSGIEYANAFELRNYPPAKPQSVAEIERANLIIVDTVNESEEAVGKFLDGLLKEAPSVARAITIDRHRAVRIERDVTAQKLGPGASAAPGGQTQPDGPESFVHVATHIAHGKNVISLEGTVPTQASPSTLKAVIAIQDSIRFDTPDGR